ncbi:transposase domain-containing protein [Streptomyces umbrinus]|nr:transposase domain-containing protein [Streptomyces umbrinus]
MSLYTDCGYRQVWAALTAGWPRDMVADPSAAALRQARKRLGPRPHTTRPAGYPQVRLTPWSSAAPAH